MKLLNLAQGSPEWHAWRAGRFTASNAAAILQCSPWQPKTPLQLYMVRTGQMVIRETPAMTAGKADEPRILAEVSAALGCDLMPACVERDVDGLPLGASLDGVNWDAKMAVELKRPVSGSESNLFSGLSAPAHYLAQMAHQLLVCPVLESVGLWVWAHDIQQVRLVDVLDRAGGRYQKLERELLQGWRAFMASVAAFEPPEAAEDDVIELGDDWEFAGMVAHYRSLVGKKETIEAQLEDARAAIIALAKAQGHGCKVKGGGALVYQATRAGSVNWKAKPIKAALEAAGINPDDYRGTSTSYWAVRVEDDA